MPKVRAYRFWRYEVNMTEGFLSVIEFFNILVGETVNKQKNYSSDQCSYSVL